MRQLVFSSVPCSHREWARAKYAGRSAARVMAACRAISVPGPRSATCRSISLLTTDSSRLRRLFCPYWASFRQAAGNVPPVFHREELALGATPSPVGSRVCVSLSPQADALVWRAEP
jgi:hypothetical protein